MCWLNIWHKQPKGGVGAYFAQGSAISVHHTRGSCWTDSALCGGVYGGFRNRSHRTGTRSRYSPQRPSPNDLPSAKLHLLKAPQSSNGTTTWGPRFQNTSLWRLFQIQTKTLLGGFLSWTVNLINTQSFVEGSGTVGRVCWAPESTPEYSEFKSCAMLYNWAILKKLLKALSCFFPGKQDSKRSDFIQWRHLPQISPHRGHSSY